MPAEPWAALLHALAATGLGAVAAVPLVLALVRLPTPWAASLGGLLLLPALLPLPGPETPLAQAALLLPFLALPPGWGLRRMPAGALRIAASLAPPAMVVRRVWLAMAWPWLAAGLGLGLARALAAAGLVWPAAAVLLVLGAAVLRAVSR
jgi:hypothetical protein